MISLITSFLGSFRIYLIMGAAFLMLALGAFALHEYDAKQIATLTANVSTLTTVTNDQALALKTINAQVSAIAAAQSVFNQSVATSDQLAASQAAAIKSTPLSASNAADAAALAKQINAASDQFLKSMMSQ